jgi:hypothetical protein
MYASDVPLQVDGLGIVRLDFKGGIRLRVEQNISSGLGGVRLVVNGFEMSAESERLGRVTLSQADTDTTPLSLLEIIGNSPVYRSTVSLDVTGTVEKAPSGDSPLTLSNTKTMSLINPRMTTFPPQGSVYQLQQPVDLAPVGAPNQVVAQLQQFPVTVSHNP